ncbi:MAG TPA: leucine--tRNA ligase [Candidatus Thalassarchaeaceae archaeon]|nr:leucine--tRNA ligase [Candidatus Thalassarchaeaceae archaeon]
MQYNPQELETRWQNKWAKYGVFEAEIDLSKPKFYCLEMFPYPSGNMHMGHVRNYSIGDSMARFQRLMGKNVLYPMGYDSFGMPAENAAKKEGEHPNSVTHRNIASIRADQERMGYSYDWKRLLATSDVNYYRWNQEMFLTMFEKGLVERKMAPVNWCTDCDTVLANEQVKNNRCWRCGLEVIQRDMAQWFLRMTQYSDELLDELENIAFPENVKTMQRNWIGRSHGAHIDFQIVSSENSIGAFTTRPDTIFGVTFLTLSPDHPLCKDLCTGTEWEAGWRELQEECSLMSEFERINMLKEKKGVFLGRKAINPINGEEIPIYAGNFVVASYGTGAVMGVPGHDQRDFEFANAYDLEIRKVILQNNNENPSEPLSSAFEGVGPLANSSNVTFDGLSGNDAKDAIIAELENLGAGYGTTEYRLKDWLLSRQRFWGTPIPMLHCETCGIVPAARKDLPISLPLDVVFNEEQQGNPLSSHAEFVNAPCPSCNGHAVRETDTMDTFFDSSWYFMRFCDANNDSEPFGKSTVDYWMGNGVDLYIGGIEHAVMHLLYARFFTKFTRDAGMNDVGEPFGRLVCQGMLNAPAPYCSECNAEYHVDYFNGNCPTCAKTLGSRSAKMSKSLGNTVSPEEMVSRYGADSVRLFILFGANPEAGMDWSDDALEANHKQIHSIIEAFEYALSLHDSPSEMDDWIIARLRVNQRVWVEAMSDVSLREAVMISHFVMLADWNWYIRRGGASLSTSMKLFRGWIPMLAPATPHIAEELWDNIGGDEMLATHKMQLFDDDSLDQAVIFGEIYLRNLISSSRNLKSLAERHSDSKITSATIQTSPIWKYELARKALELAKLGSDFKIEGQSFLKSLEIFSNETLRGEIFHTWSILTTGSKKKRGRVHSWSDAEKALILSDFDEADFIDSNSQFITDALDLTSIKVYSVGDGDDIGGKAKLSFPLDPGIAFL